MHRSLLALALTGWAMISGAALAPTSPRGVDLSGRWKLNTQLSDDAERLLAERLEEERRRYAQWRRREEAMRPPGVPPLDVEAEVESRRTPSPARRLSQQRRDEDLHRMLAISQTLEIFQRGADVQIVSAVESRSVTAGSRTQVSMPQGQLADASVGWEGQWFVIERKVRRGPRVLERYRLLRTGQLEYTMSWSGDTELSGLKLRRVFDRLADPVFVPAPALGPVR